MVETGPDASVWPSPWMEGDGEDEGSRGGLFKRSRRKRARNQEAVRQGAPGTDDPEQPSDG